MTEVGLEPGPPAPWPITYSGQNLEEWAGFYWDREKGTGVLQAERTVWHQGAILTVK